MLGAGMSATTVAADKLEAEKDKKDTPHTIRAYLGDEVIAQFPADTPYLFIKRDLMECLTRAEMLTKEAAEEKEMKALYKSLGIEGDTPPAPAEGITQIPPTSDAIGGGDTPRGYAYL